MKRKRPFEKIDSLEPSKRRAAMLESSSTNSMLWLEKRKVVVEATNRVLEAQSERMIALAEKRILEAESARKLVEVEKRALEAEWARRLIEAEKRAIESEYQKRLTEAECRRKLAEAKYLAETESLRLQSKVATLEIVAAGTGIAHRAFPTLKRKAHNFPWLRVRKFPSFPKDIMREVTTYLEDNDRFNLRSLNSMFYGAYYDQTGDADTNSVRVIKLATMGRRFRKLTRLTFNCKELPASAFRYINVHSLPSLRELKQEGGGWLSQDEGQSIKHPGIRILRFDFDRGVDLQAVITQERYPNLESLTLVVPNSEDPFELAPHNRLKEMKLFAHLNGEFFDHVTRVNYPKLTKITVDSSNLVGVNQQTLKERFERANIEFIGY